ncbi:MAG: type II secretion system protein [Synergistaceae bacterium]|nr:type II secretion system protein [Synergistaceae bacterium]
MKNTRKGFTLIEFFIVLAINLILGTAIMFRMSSSLAEMNKHSHITASYSIEQKNISEKNS